MLEHITWDTTSGLTLSLFYLYFLFQPTMLASHEGAAPPPRGAWVLVLKLNLTCHGFDKFIVIRSDLNFEAKIVYFVEVN